MAEGYLRYPHLHGEDIVFVAADDVWIAPVEGGRAARLTADRCPVAHPRFSPDGTRIAFTSTRDGHREVMVLDRAAGTTTRLTWWGSSITTVVGWLDDEHVVAATDHGQPFTRRWWLHAVGLDGRTRRLPYGAATGLARHPGGAVAITSPNSRDAAMWKRYRGGTARRLWLDPTGQGRWRPLLADQAAGVYSPAWVGDRLVFCSDLGATLPDHADEQSQLWSLDRDGGDLRQHTRHTFDGAAGPAGYVRDPSTDGTRLTYHARGRLYVLEGLERPQAQLREIEIDLGATAPARATLEPTERLQAVRPDRRGDASLLHWHGAAWWLTHRGGPARELLGGDGVRIREPRHLGTTGRVVAVTDAEGEDALEIVAVDALAPPRRLAQGRLGRVLHLEASPAGDVVAAIAHDGRVRLVDVDSGDIADIGHSVHHEAVDLAFSPDGRYLVWSEPGPDTETCRLVCVDRGEGTAGLRAAPDAAVPLTGGRFDDRCAVFTGDGRHLVFLSARTLDPTYERYTFDLSFHDAVRPWLVPLRATDPAPFGPSADGWPVADVADARKEGDDGPAEPPAPPACVMDVDGFEERMVAFPVPSGEYDGLRAAKDGVLWIRRMRTGGELGSTRAGVEGEAERDVLERYSFTGRTLESLGTADSFAVSADGERVVVRDKDALVVLPAAHKVEEDSPERLEVGLDRLRRDVDLRVQWRQMFDENGRLMRDHFWRADMDGVDWARVLRTYRPVVERLASHDDLVDLLWETVGELGTSHCYVIPASRPGDTSRALGHLGADLRRADDGAVVIERILPGESSDPQARSPLRAAGVAAAPGDRILAVDGRAVAGVRHVGELLQGAADRVVELTLGRDGVEPRRVAVLPIGSEETLRYHDWVASRRAYVTEASAGRLGYLHVPDMVAAGWAQLHRDLEEAVRHEGLVVDVRYNRGGHTSQLVVARLSRRIIGWDVARHSAAPASYPLQAPRGPLAVVCNRFSGSDGDIVNAAVQEYGLGPVIGERTWGGVIGIDGRFDLVDGTGVTQPRYASVFVEHGWGVENHGVDPDIEVVMGPADWESDRDPQLDRTVAELLTALERTPAASPPSLPAPRVADGSVGSRPA